MINDSAANMEQFIVTAGPLSAGWINFQFRVWKRRDMRGDLMTSSPVTHFYLGNFFKDLAKHIAFRAKFLS